MLRMPGHPRHAEHALPREHRPDLAGISQVIIICTVSRKAPRGSWRKHTMARRSAESTVNGRATITRRSDRFLAGLAGATAVTFVSHVQPDPDSLGSMLGLAHLVETCLGKPTRLTRDGLISRAENRAMVDLLGISLVPIEDVVLEEGEALVMVDSQPNTGRHSFDPELPLYAVIDHH